MFLLAVNHAPDEDQTPQPKLAEYRCGRHLGPEVSIAAVVSKAPGDEHGLAHPVVSEKEPEGVDLLRCELEEYVFKLFGTGEEGAQGLFSVFAQRVMAAADGFADRVQPHHRKRFEERTETEGFRKGRFLVVFAKHLLEAMPENLIDQRRVFVFEIDVPVILCQIVHLLERNVRELGLPLDDGTGRTGRQGGENTLPQFVHPLPGAPRLRDHFVRLFGLGPHPQSEAGGETPPK